MATVLAAGTALAHFGMLIPSEDVVLDKSKAKIDMTICFVHPMEGEGMNMVKPQAVAVNNGEKSSDLLGSHKPAKVMDHEAWQLDYTFKRPGVYWFSVIPEPYWEPAEDCFIQHITKVCVPAFGEVEGWDAPLGLPTEIVP
jgi:cobalt/nickel transport protein